MKIKDVARIAHEVNRAYCTAIGDTSQPAWKDAPEWQKDSAISGVMHFMKDIHVTPQSMHENWMRDKVADGWVYGLYKDPVNKEHPCLVPYDELPLEQRVKDHLFLAVCNAWFNIEDEQDALA